MGMTMKQLITFLLCFWCLNINAQELRIVSVGSNITEILYALELGKHVVASDKTSTEPTTAVHKAVLGHPNNISIEGVISHLPTHFVSDNKYPNSELTNKLNRLGVKSIILRQATTINELLDQIDKLGHLFNRQAQARLLITSLNEKKQKLSELKPEKKITAAFIYGKNNLLMMGKNTTVDHLLVLASIENGFTFEGIKPVNPESLLMANPDVLLTVDKALTNENSKVKFFTLPGIAGTNAGQDKLIYAIPIKQINITLKTLDTALSLHHLIYGNDN
ncbi:ABC transporter substrate-binding protein [Vibrio alginolyticus]|nr:ABC transporter substrate-binding protein [Vibrio alginolyticus]